MTTITQTPERDTETVEPALMVAFGATSNKRRLLDKSAMLIGRAACCDIRVDAPEISPIHCLVTRDESNMRTSFRIRDCDSRCGVIVNGQPVRETELQDGDTIQLGPFSFIAALPAATVALAEPAAPGSKDQLAMNLADERDKIHCLHNHIAGVEAERDRLAAQLHDLRVKMERNPEPPSSTEERDSLHQEVSQLRVQLEAAAREQARWDAESAQAANQKENNAWLEDQLEIVSSERNRWKAEVETLEFAIQQSRRDAQAYLEQLDKAMRDGQQATQRRDELQAKCAQFEARCGSLEQELQGARDERDQAAALAQATVNDSPDLGEELDNLRSKVSSLEAQQVNVIEERDQALAQIEVLMRDGQHEDDARTQAVLAELEAANERAQAAEQALQDIQQQLQSEQDLNERRLAALRQELEKERLQLKQLVIQAAAQHTETQSQIDSLRGQLSGQKPDEIRSSQFADSELDDLRQQVRDLQTQLAASPASVPEDLSQYERELHQFRDDLERAQEDITRREAELDQEKTEVMERLKRTELELARDRAAMARDRAEFDRLRRDFQSEMEHAEREAGTRARLAPIDQLANEVRGQVQDDPAPASKLSKRIGSLLRRMNGNS